MQIRILFWVLSLLALPVFVYATPFGSASQNGVDLYNQEEYSRALKEFEAARLAEPENGEVLYNLANTHYQLGNYDHAAEAYSAAEAALNDPALKQKAHYNRGNAYYRMGNINKAISEYKKALELSPDDMDAKFNLEFARKQKERAEQSGRMQPNDMNQEQKPRPGGLNPSTADKPGSSDTDPKKEPSPQPSATDDRDTPDKEDTPSSETRQAESHPEPSPDKPQTGDAEQHQQVAQALKEVTAMNKEEADRWLNSLDEDLSKMSRRQAQGQMKDLFVEGGKDW